MNYRDYLNEDRLPHTWCGGCGNGMVLNAVVRAFADLGLDPTQIVVVTGIGCWGKADDYVKTNTFHGTHGRALAFATGIKLANPDLHVVALMGDGDGVTIGGNHFIHAARRNIDVTAIVVNNLNYGMTGGQYSGTTPEHSITATSLYGHIEDGFDICRLADAAGANYVARAAADSVMQLKKFIAEGMKKKGFSVIEAISMCPTHYGKSNNMRTSAEMLQWIKKHSVTAAQAKTMSGEELHGKFVMGKMVDRSSADYGTKYLELSAKVRAKEL